MTEQEQEVYLDKALYFIVDQFETDPSIICEKLHEIDEELVYCGNNCKNFNRECVLRFLKYYQ